MIYDEIVEEMNLVRAAKGLGGLAVERSTPKYGRRPCRVVREMRRFDRVGRSRQAPCGETDMITPTPHDRPRRGGPYQDSEASRIERAWTSVWRGAQQLCPHDGVERKSRRLGQPGWLPAQRLLAFADLCPGNGLDRSNVRQGERITASRKHAHDHHRLGGLSILLIAPSPSSAGRGRLWANLIQCKVPPSQNRRLCRVPPHRPRGS